jgi:hypothetical protein
MTEAEWLVCTDPQRMLEYLGGAMSDRKLRLFACACLRNVWNQLTEERSRTGVEVNERFADAQASGEELWTAAIEARKVDDAAAKGVWLAAGPADSLWRAGRAAGAAVEVVERAAAREAFKAGPEAVVPAMRVAAEATRRVQAELLRDLAGNPFRPVVLDPAWRTPSVRGLAQAAYDDRILPQGLLDRPCLAILADALLDAGCNDTDLLTHLRGPGPHVRGCLAVDLLLA